jgi:hypothetical protein
MFKEDSRLISVTELVATLAEIILSLHKASDVCGISTFIF